MRTALKALTLCLLGVALAFLVACGDRSGLLPGEQASRLRSALDAVDARCASGDVAGAQQAAQVFQDRVNRLPPRSVDRKLIANLQQGASTLNALLPSTCTATTDTTVTTPETTETVPTTTAPTTPTTTEPTTPTTTEPPVTTPTTTTPPATAPGGGTPNGNGPDGTGPPGQSGGATPDEETP